MLAFVHGPSGALHLATAALSAPSCSGFPPVPRPTNQRTRIFPSEVSPPGRDGSAVTSAPVGRGVGLDVGAGAEYAPATRRAAVPCAISVRQLGRFTLRRLPMITNRGTRVFASQCISV